MLRPTIAGSIPTHLLGPMVIIAHVIDLLGKKLDVCLASWKYILKKTAPEEVPMGNDANLVKLDLSQLHRPKDEVAQP